MFKICQQQSIKFNSDKTNNKNSNHQLKSTISIQTDAIKTLDKEIQSLSVEDKSVQVNLERNLIENDKNFNYNTNKLLKFLNYASNLTIKEIEESILIENDLKYIELMNYDSEELNPIFYYSSSKLPIDNTNNNLISKDNSLSSSSKLTIEHIIWSSNLNQLILGFCVSKHNYWCTHNSRIEFCNLYEKSDKRPNLLKTIFKIEIKNCITTMISHPIIFTQIAVGTKSGSILIIDRDLKKLNPNTSLNELNELSNDNTNQQCIKYESNQHKLEITYLSFKQNNLDSNETVYDELLSCSLDGKIIIWKIKNLDKQLQQLKLIDINKQTELTTKQIELGIKCACFDQDYLIISSENYLYSIFLNKNKQLNFNLNELDFEYDKHKGEIESIELNYLNRNQFLTNAKDNELRLYEKNQRTPLLIIYLDQNQFNFKWINLLKKKINQFIIGLNDNNLLIINIYTKDKKYSTSNQIYSLKDIFTKLFINKANQLALINSNDEVYLFDLNVLFE